VGLDKSRKRQHRNKPDGEPQQGDGHSTFCKKKIKRHVAFRPLREFDCYLGEADLL